MVGRLRAMSEVMRLAALVSFFTTYGAALVSGRHAFPEKRAIEMAQHMDVRRLDPSVTLKRSFEHWLRALVGRDTTVTWEVNDCGESTGSAADIGRDIPACVEAIAHLSPRKNAVVSILVGTNETGIAGRPAVFQIAIVEGNDVQGMRSLSELAARLQK